MIPLLVIFSLLVFVVGVTTWDEWERCKIRPLHPSLRGKKVDDNPKNITYDEQRELFTKQCKIEKKIIIVRVMSLFLFFGLFGLCTVLDGVLRTICGVVAMLIFLIHVSTLGGGGDGGECM